MGLGGSESSCPAFFKRNTMKPVPQKISVRLNELHAPLQKFCNKNDTTPSAVMREALAAYLKVKVPKVAVGNPNFSKQKS